jgi:hypothetical protein
MLALLPGLSLLSATETRAEVEPFLKSAGARGFLAEEEEAILALRKEKEGQAREELEKERSIREADARNNQKGLYGPISF